MSSLVGVTQRLAMVTALLAVFVAALDLTVISTILPGMIFDLEISITELDQAAWIVTAYLLAYTVAIPVLGRLSDRTSRTAVFVIALLLFAVGSLWCGQARSLGPLIVGRIIQALGGGAMVPVTMALVADRLPPGRRATALGLVAAVDTAGWVAGPLYGAAVVGLFGTWRWVFWINLPLAVLTLLGLLIAQAASTGVAGVGRPRWLASWRGLLRVDWPGAGLLTLALIGLNLGLSLGGEPLSAGGTLAEAERSSALLAPYRWPLLIAGLLGLVGFVVVERRSREPLVPIGLWRQPAFAAASLVNLLLGGALIVAMVNVPVFVNTLAPDLATAQWQSALLLTPLTGGMALGSLAGGWLAGRVGPRSVALLGLGLAVVGFVQMSGWPARLDLAAMGPPLGLLGLGFGLVIAPAASVAVDSVGRDDYGIASALVLLLRLIGMAIGLSALTSWALSQLSARLRALPPPAPGPGETAAEFASRLGSEIARRAIDVGTRVLGDTFWIAAILCLLTLLPAWWLTHRRPSQGR